MSTISDSYQNLVRLTSTRDATTQADIMATLTTLAEIAEQTERDARLTRMEKAEIHALILRWVLWTLRDCDYLPVSAGAQ